MTEPSILTSVSWLIDREKVIGTEADYEISFTVSPPLLVTCEVQITFPVEIGLDHLDTFEEFNDLITTSQTAAGMNVAG